jgi:general secretion pathway protein B
MSFILDALKKSESERQRQAGPALLEMRIIPPRRGLPAWAIVIGAVLLVSVGVLGWLALRSHPAPATAATHIAVPMATLQPNAGATQAAAQGDVPQSAAAPGLSSETVAAPQAPARLPPGVPSRGATDAGDANEPIPPEDNAADNEPAVAPQADSQDAAKNAAALRKYSEISGTVPELRLDLHVYSANPAERYAFINMHKVHEGDTTPEGARVQQITRDGVVLDYNGSEFLLGRQ